MGREYVAQFPLPLLPHPYLMADGRRTALQKYYTVAGDYTYPIPENMTMEQGALVEPVAVAVQICKVAELRGGQTVLVFGCGPIGSLCQAVARAYGAGKVVGVDISEARARFAGDFGADQVYVSKRLEGAPEDPVAAAREVGEKIVRDFGLGGGADVVIEATGVESCIQSGIFAARKGGMFVQAGMGKEVSDQVPCRRRMRARSAKNIRTSSSPSRRPASGPSPSRAASATRLAATPRPSSWWPRARSSPTSSSRTGSSLRRRWRHSRW